MDEKRKHKRIKKGIRSEVHSTEGVTFSVSTDLSHGGIFISTPEPVRDGSQVDLCVYIPGQEPVEMKGVIRWTRQEEQGGQKTGMGIEFLNPSKKELETIKKAL